MKRTHRMILGICMILLCSCNYIQNVKLLTNGAIQQRNFIETISFDYPKKLIVVNAIISADELERRFIFDTGAFNSKIEQGLADSLGFKKVATKNNSTAQGITQKIEVTPIDSLKLGQTLFTNIGAGKLEYNKQSASRCLAPAGIIGANLIKLAYWRIDYQTQELSFSDNPFEVEESEFKIEIPFKRPILSGTPKIDIQVGGRTVEGVLFDVGYNGGLILPAQFADKFKSETTQLLIDQSTTGIYGSNIDTLTIKSLPITIDGFTTNIPVEFSSIGKALIGNDFLEHFDVFINYKTKNITLYPVSEIQIMDTYSFIPGVLNDSLWVVNRTTPESPLQLGDTLLSVQGKTPIELFPSYCDYVQGISELIQDSTMLIETMSSKEWRHKN